MKNEEKQGAPETGFLRKYFVVASKFAKNPVSLSECVNPDRRFDEFTYIPV
ncbi:MAG: hypothetical protein U7126_15160 [Microcoleus sp.]